MLSEQSHSCLNNEIQYLRRDLTFLHLEILGIQRFYNPAAADWFQWKIALFNWKKTRLEALELFAHSHFAITGMEQSHSEQAAYTGRAYNKSMHRKKWRPRKKTHAICSGEGSASGPGTLQNRVEKGNKENQPSQVESVGAVQIKTEIDTKENIAQSIAETLKNLKIEKDQDLKSFVDSNSVNVIPQLSVTNVKVEVDCNIVKNESRKRKRKNRAEKRRAKMAKLQ